jgi:hypothetical protein
MKIEYEASSDRSVLQLIAELVGLTADEWSDISIRIPKRTDRLELTMRLLATTARTPTVLFCLYDYVVLQYDGFISLKHSPLHNGRSGSRITGKNEIVDPISRLSAESLRSICVLLEALVYKLVHLKVENGSASYGPKTQNYQARIDRLLEEKLITKSISQLASELYKTRNQFAHSIRSVGELTYMSLPLKVR